MTAAPNFEGHEGRYCGEHRTVGPHRAWCYDCSEWCYPDVAEGTPRDGACNSCRVPWLEEHVVELHRQRDSARDWAVALENRIAKALTEHERLGDFPPDKPLCGTCVDAETAARLWPCPTVAALTGGEDDARA